MGVKEVREISSGIKEIDVSDVVESDSNWEEENSEKEEDNEEESDFVIGNTILGSDGSKGWDEGALEDVVETESTTDWNRDSPDGGFNYEAINGGGGNLYGAGSSGGNLYGAVGGTTSGNFYNEVGRGGGNLYNEGGDGGTNETMYNVLSGKRKSSDKASRLEIETKQSKRKIDKVRFP